MEKNKLHLNIPQLFFHLLWCQINVLIWGRGTGKTEGPQALFTLLNIFEMPRSNGAIIGMSYDQLLTRTLPPLIAGWERYGYIEGIHFWVKKFAPENFRVPKAYRYPRDPVHYIQWYNGSGIYLISQDRAGLSNSLSFDWLAGDEARLLDYQRLMQDTIPALRGNAAHFGHLFNHHSILFTSDMPRTTTSRWLLEYQKQMDSRRIELMLSIRLELEATMAKYENNKTTKRCIRSGRFYRPPFRRKAGQTSRRFVPDFIWAIRVWSFETIPTQA